MRYLLILIGFLSLTNVSYASFPVSANTSIEVVDELKSEPLRYGADNSKFGRRSFFLAILSLVIFIISIALEFIFGIIIFPIVGLFALYYGIKGCFTTESKILAIIGLVLGALEFCFLILLMLIL